ncbi:MAG: hypothetical protein GY820_12475 [Gammaproteobacteria bacterium]|nr:hypothetical protein [Gammaproteobacteria bacterium]
MRKNSNLFRAYDNQLLLKRLLEKGVAVENISRGMNLMRLQVNNVLVLDSLNFIPMPLSKMPKAFDLAGVKKGYFPHFFNKLTTPWDYGGPFPHWKIMAPIR